VSIQELGSLGEFLGAIGVIVSLIYLATQIRQNTRAIRSSAVQASTSITGSTVALMGQNPHNADVFHRGLRSYDELSESEQTHFTIMVSGVFTNADATYWDHRHGLLPPEVWDRSQRLVQFYMETPGGQRVWRIARRSLVSRPFAEFVDATFGSAKPPAA
jgi:thymidylate synthase ThyX